jgi:hypothetical protein
MSNAIVITKFFNSCILELTSIVTSHFLDSNLKLIVNSSEKGLKDIKHFTFITKKEYPCEFCKVIHYDKVILVAAYACVGCWAK